MTGVPAATCVILPTRNEEANIVEVLNRLDALGICSELVVVDDSDDATAPLALAQVDNLRATLIVRHRTGGERRGGLGTAIIEGIDRSVASNIVVMDADLQHPPELVPLLVEQLTGADLAIASRHNWDNVIEGLSPIRRITSRLAGALAFRLFPGELAGVSDPMSGFFSCRRDALDLSRLEPMGYKILLEILGTHPELRIAEVPFAFGRRLEGESKAGAREGVRYVRHLVDLRRRRRDAPASKTRPSELV